MVSGFDPNGPRDIVFVPVGINYDRVLEDRVLTAAAVHAQGRAPALRVQSAGALGVDRQEPVAAGQGQLAPLRLCLRQLRPAACRCAATSPSAASTSAPCPSSSGSPRSSGWGSSLMARGRPRRAGAAGVAGGERHPGRRRAGAVELRAQGLRVRADAPAAGRRARTCTSPATTRSTPSTSACACCMLRHLVDRGGRHLPRQPQGDGAAGLLRQRHRPPAAGIGACRSQCESADGRSANLQRRWPVGAIRLSPIAPYAVTPPAATQRPPQGPRGRWRPGPPPGGWRSPSSPPTACRRSTAR